MASDNARRTNIPIAQIADQWDCSHDEAASRLVREALQRLNKAGSQK